MKCKWISVNDFVPEDGISVIAYDPSLWVHAMDDREGRFVCRGIDNVGQFCSGIGWAVGGGEADGVTHWMYFPSPPNTRTEATDGTQGDI